MGMTTRVPVEHGETVLNGAQIQRAPSPFFHPPVPSGMREPGTNYITIVTAAGPHTTEHPGIAAGFRPGPGANAPVYSVPPLTRKGG
jgi:hypothetical protein